DWNPAPWMAQTNSPAVSLLSLGQDWPKLNNEEVQMAQTKRRILFRPASVLLLGALAMLLAQSVAHADLTITGGSQEVIGDPGGTNFSNPDGSAAGKGLPTLLGGWASGPGFAPDPTFSNNPGISGFSSRGPALTLDLSSGEAAAGPVSFTFFGKGNSSLNDQFQVNGQTLFGPGNYSQGQTIDLNLAPGKIPFGWITGNGQTVNNGESHDPTTSPAFFVGVDPSKATGTFQTTAGPGTSVFVGLTDLPAPGDHDFQDLGVRITTVPEPASLIMGSTAALIGLGCAWSRRKRASA
ncbi:MAG TPA: hypothetical protein VKP69_27410, partial [Isosphaeraceae bacterium]|nr:hypothetical protein [Isosphaeraceae bacterium]